MAIMGSECRVSFSCMATCSSAAAEPPNRYLLNAPIMSGAARGERAASGLNSGRHEIYQVTERNERTNE